MCHVVRCPDCAGWLLSSCEVHGWSVDDFEPGQLCGCQAAAKPPQMAADHPLSPSDSVKSGHRGRRKRR